MKKWNDLFKRLFASNRFLKIFSLVVAFITWVIVATAIEPDYTMTIRNVPINTEASASLLSKFNLNIISIEPETADVEVTGARYVVGKLDPSDIKIVPKLISVNNAGSQSLRLEWDAESSLDSESYTVGAISPVSVTIRTDRMDTKALTVQANISGVSLPDGYIKEQEVVSPETVTLTGPISDLDKVAHAIVSVNVDKSLSGTETVVGEITLVDSDGNRVVSDHIRMDYDTAEVTIPVLKEKTVPLGIKFLNIPPGFPMAELKYTLSNESILVAGPATLVDNYSEIELGYVDFKRLELDSKQVFDVELPSGFVNVDNIQSVSVSFNTDGFIMKSFNISEIDILNPPANYDVTINQNSQKLNNVKIIGPAEVLETMTAEDLIAEVDLSDREIVTGQISVPVRIYAPNKGTVWAYGDYLTVVSIAEKSE